MKKGAVSPLYLHLACEDLRNFGSFDKVCSESFWEIFKELQSPLCIFVHIYSVQLKETLQLLPDSLSQLIQHSLDRMCSQHRGILGFRWAMAAFTVSSSGEISV